VRPALLKVHLIMRRWAGEKAWYESNDIVNRESSDEACLHSHHICKVFQGGECSPHEGDQRGPTWVIYKSVTCEVQ
jgi:hypothetical protein